MGAEGASVALGAIGSLYGASRSARAQRRGADQLGALAEPYLEQARFALPQLRWLAKHYYQPRLNQDSPYLRAEHGENLAALQRANTQGLAEIQHTYASHGNLGRARGERLRLANSLVRATSRENLSYGEAQQSYRDTTATQYQELLARLAGLGATGMPYAAEGIKLRAAGDKDFWDFFTKLFGSPGTWAGALGGGESA